MIFLILGNKMLSLMDQGMVIFKCVTVVGIDVKIEDGFVYCEVYLLNFPRQSSTTLTGYTLTAVTSRAPLATTVIVTIVISHMVLIEIHSSVPLSAIY